MKILHLNYSDSSGGAAIASYNIFQAQKKMGLDVWFLRPLELSHDKASKIPAIIHALHQAEKYFKKKYSYVVDLDATSPLRKVDDIVEAMQKFRTENAENLVTVCLARKNPYFNMLEYEDNELKLVKPLDSPINRRQDAPIVYEMNASIYIWKRSCLLEEKPLINKKTSHFIMPEERSIDIDTESDFKYVEHLMKYN